MMSNKLRSFIWLTIAVFCVVTFRTIIDIVARARAGWLTWLIVIILIVGSVISVMIWDLSKKEGLK
ncbi:MAG: hypothetical protein Q3996_03105 [Candidatus Saccharibacteria bacterium]|nr:hypothetical protein [Candidatus Saccharibacteria bacterium]